MKGGPKSSLRPFLHQALHIDRYIYIYSRYIYIYIVDIYIYMYWSDGLGGELI